MDEVGAVTEAQSRKLKPMFLYHSVRKPGYVYELTWCRGDYYQCAHCRKLGKKRVIAIRQNCIVVGNKHPEDDHHVYLKKMAQQQSLTVSQPNCCADSFRKFSQGNRISQHYLTTASPSQVSSSIPPLS